MNLYVIVVNSFTERDTMRSHKVYSRSTLPSLQPGQHHHHHHHQRHSVATSRRKTPSPERIRSSAQHVSASAARLRPEPAKAPLRMKTMGRSRPLPPPLEPLKAGHRIDPQERVFLEAAEHGDKHTVQRCLQGPQPVNVNCTNILGRSAIQVMNNTCCSSNIHDVPIKHIMITRIPCCRKETARCRTCSFRLKFANNSHYKYKTSQVL